MGILLGWLLVIPLIGVLALWRGYALTWLWQWFVVPFGLPEIGVWHAAGISLIMAFLTYENNGPTDSIKALEKLGMAFLVPLSALVFGWLWHTFM